MEQIIMCMKVIAQFVEVVIQFHNMHTIPAMVALDELQIV